MPGSARRRALAILAALVAAGLTAGSSRARDPDWADDPLSAKVPAYAASRALCRGLKGVTPPPGDAPTPAEAAALADCSSEALYYGIGRPVDFKAARLCASLEISSADPQVTDFGFTGERMLMTAYANGLGVARNLDVATALACRTGFAPAETDGRVNHLARLKAEGWAGTDFSLCDDITSGMMQGVCAGHRQLVARAARRAALQALSAGWSPAQKAAFAPLAQAGAAFADARGENEVDQTGTGRAAFVIAAEDDQDSAFAALLADVDGGRLPPATQGERQAAEAGLAAAEAALARRVPALARTTTLTAAGLASAQRIWRRYRDAWIAFAKAGYPAVSSETLLVRLTQKRAAQLADISMGAE